MALGKNMNSIKRASSLNTSLDALNGRLEFANCTRTLSRKRVSVSNFMEMESLHIDLPLKIPSKKRYFSPVVDTKRMSLDALPQDILIRIVCCVDHEDLKQLFRVSKPIREATLVAKQWHFEFSTPNSRTAGVKTFNELGDRIEFEMESPNSPIRNRFGRPRISRKKLKEIAIALFHSPKEDDP